MRFYLSSTKYKTAQYLNNLSFTISRLIFDEADGINIPACEADV